MYANKHYVVSKLIERRWSVLRKYGQNFLVDENIAHKIVESLKIKKNDQIIEIGPGLGALTEHLCKYPNHVSAYDIDELMITILRNAFKENENIEIIHQDFLKVKFSPETNKIIGNLPYYITTSIIEKILLEGEYVTCFVAMIQKETAVRLSSKQGTKEYGPLNILIELLGGMKIVTHVNRECFYPTPHIDSTVFKMNIVRPQDINLKSFYWFLNKAFAFRRKTLANNLARHYDKENVELILQKLNVSLEIRSEDLDLESYIKIYLALAD